MINRSFTLYVTLVITTFTYKNHLKGLEETFWGESYYDALLVKAYVSHLDGNYHQAHDLYNSIITTQDAISKKLRAQAIFLKGELLITLPEYQKNNSTIAQARELFKSITDMPFKKPGQLHVQNDEIDPENWVYAHVWLASMDKEQKHSDILAHTLSAAHHYVTIISVGKDLPPYLVITPLMKYAEIIYDNNSIVTYPYAEMLQAYDWMMLAYKNISKFEREEHQVENPNFYTALLHYAQILSQGLKIPPFSPDYKKAAQLYKLIIKKPSNTMYPETKNRARINLAGLYLRQEIPNDSPEINHIIQLYKDALKNSTYSKIHTERVKELKKLKMIGSDDITSPQHFSQAEMNVEILGGKEDIARENFTRAKLGLELLQKEKNTKTTVDYVKIRVYPKIPTSLKL